LTVDDFDKKKARKKFVYFNSVTRPGTRKQHRVNKYFKQLLKTTFNERGPAWHSVALRGKAWQLAMSKLGSALDFSGFRLEIGDNATTFELLQDDRPATQAPNLQDPFKNVN